MPLTPDDVSKKRFATSRMFREGYDMTEVDSFLDEIEAELTRLGRENAELRRSAQAPAPAPTAPETPAESATADQTTADQTTADQTTADPTADSGETSEPVAEPVTAEVTGPTVEGVPTTHSAPSGPTMPHREELLVTTTEEASAAAARMLQIAGRNADELVAEAQAQAEQVVAEAQTRAETLEVETAKRKEELSAELERDRSQLTAEVENLRTFEREYRTQLRSYFEQQLESLDAQGGGVSLAEPLSGDDPAMSGRLKAILAEEADETSADPS